MTPHETGSTTTPGAPRATAPLTRTFGPQGPTLGDLIDAYLQDYQVRQFRSQSTARGRTAHLAAFFGRAARAATLTTYQILEMARRKGTFWPLKKGPPFLSCRGERYCRGTSCVARDAWLRVAALSR